ncbi:MAG: LPS assembly protein LptD [Bryobacteraceae bacterium]|nr:LPS assembly protein LptD [Bryobacteraceae bacterium]
MPRPGVVPPPAVAAPKPLPLPGVAGVRPGAPPADEAFIEAIDKQVRNGVYNLRGLARIETREALITADEIDYDEETGDAQARGNVYFKHFLENEELWADRVDYNLGEETGKFFNVQGRAQGKIEPRPGLLYTSNPFTFQGEWAERVGQRYYLYKGQVTNCRVPRPNWVLTGPKFDIIPGDRAIAYKSWFKFRKVPIFYAPVFFKALSKQPRKSGFLTPNIGNSSRRGKMIAASYYWAINRSYDALYRAQLFTQRGFKHTVDFRGKPNHRSDFDIYFEGVNDRGLKLDNGERRKEGGFLLTANVQADLGRGFYAKGQFNYLSSFQFRQAFTETFNEAIFSEVQSIGWITKHWSSFGLNFVMSRKENFQNRFIPGRLDEETEEYIFPRYEDDIISIRRLPLVEFHSRDREISRKVLPVWVSFESSAGTVRRNQNLFQSRAFVERFDAEPRIMTALRWKDFHILPSYSIRETYVGSSFDSTSFAVRGENVLRSTRELGVDIIAPSLAKIYNAPSRLGTKLKHVIEPRASFRWVSGVNDFSRLIRFDETELLSNTKEAEVSLSNRFFLKRKDGLVYEALSWRLIHRRYFDPDFGGAVVDGTRNVLLSSTQLTGYTFLLGPRSYSPIISVLRASPIPSAGVEWRTDYDPVFKRFINSSITADARVSNYLLSFGHAYVANTGSCEFTQVRPKCLSPAYNQFRGLFGIGNDQKRGWNAAFSAYYDFDKAIMQYATTQVTYNLDCCGFSLQYRRFSFGIRNENQFRAAFVIANIGSFGTLKRQEQIF